MLPIFFHIFYDSPEKCIPIWNAWTILKKLAIFGLHPIGMYIIIIEIVYKLAIYLQFIFYRYPEARAKNRKIIFHAGPTNSGKTYHALERFLQSKSGVYCGPLKLLATEVFRKANDRVNKHLQYTRTMLIFCIIYYFIFLREHLVI